MNKKTTCWECNGQGQIKGVSDWAHLHDPEDAYIFTENKKCKKCNGKGYSETPTTQRPKTGKEKKSGGFFFIGIVILVTLIAIFSRNDEDQVGDSQNVSQFLDRQDAERHKKIEECRVKIGEAEKMMNEELEKCAGLFDLIEASIEKQNEIEANYQRFRDRLEDLKK